MSLFYAITNLFVFIGIFAFVYFLIFLFSNLNVWMLRYTRHIIKKDKFFLKKNTICKNVCDFTTDGEKRGW